MKSHCIIAALVVATLAQLGATAAPKCSTVVERLDAAMTKLKACTCEEDKHKCCAEVFESNPDATDGYYTLVINDKGDTKTVYCRKTIPQCGDEVVGWTRVALVDTTDKSAECPSNLFKVELHGRKYCDRDNCGGGSSACTSATLMTYGPYDKVCGRVKGYQYDGTGRVEGIFDNTGGVDTIEPNESIDGAYVDGVSITYGTPRNHIFTLIAGGRQSGNSRGDCPCNSGSKEKLPAFVGNDYYCESAAYKKFEANTVHLKDALWDGDLCKSKETNCCKNPRMPFFRKDIGKVVDDNIEFRICSSEGYPDEGTPIEQIEIYVN